MPWTSRAQSLLHESFAYPDGDLTAVSGGTWSNHFATAGAVAVANQAAILDQGRTEDVNRVFAPEGITNGRVYASFVVNFATLPELGNAYFWHFKDTGNFGAGAKVFATQGGAAAGHFRLGIANVVNAPAYAPVDLALHAPYGVVVRYDVTGSEPTVLWIDPVNEGSSLRRADAIDAHDSIVVVAAALRQANGIGALTLDDLKVGRAFEDVFVSGDPATNPPAISAVPDQFIAPDASTGELAFTVEDQESPAGSLDVSATSSDPALLPPDGIVWGGSESDRTIAITPAPSLQGAGEITLTVTDPDGNVATRTFTVKVGAPEISAVPELLTPVGSPLTGIPVWVSDAEEDADALSLTGSSSDVALLPEGSIIATGTGSQRAVAIQPAAGRVGKATVTLTVSDGHSTRSSAFVVTVHPYEGRVLEEPFDYPDGLLSASGVWIPHSTLSNQLQVVDGKIQVLSTADEDMHARLTGPSLPYLGQGGWILFASLRVAVTTLAEEEDGGYFAHFNDPQSGGQTRGRILVLTNNAAAGKYRFGVSNGSARETAVFPQDCSVNVWYRLVVAYHVETAQTTLWLDPASQLDPNVTATDLASPQEIRSFSFRQESGAGALLVDEVTVDTVFPIGIDVAPRIFAVSSEPGDRIRIQWSATPGRTYQVFFADKLDASTWSSLGLVTATEPTAAFEDTSFTPEPGQRFYRVQLQSTGAR